MSVSTRMEQKSELIDQPAQLGRQGRGSGAPPPEQVDALLASYYRHVAADDLADRTDMDVYGALVSQYRLAQERPQGTASVRVLTPTVTEHGWSAAGHSVVEIVVDDMPFLVDSVTMELGRQQREVRLVIHPQLDAVRDITGTLESVEPVADGARPPGPGVVRESWMHVEISRLPPDEDVEEIVEALQRVLGDVRDATEDWGRTRTRMLDIVTELEDEPPAGLDPADVRESRELLRWLTEDHYTFLGYREYLLERDGDDELLRAVPGSGLGILRHDPDMAAGAGKLPPKVRAKAREKTLLVLAKANSRATVHRPSYLDYVGVKMFDEQGEVIGERRFLGLFSSAAYAESLTRIPLLRERAAAVLRRLGFAPRSYAGRALMDTLETYPRDELFHTGVDELAPLAEAAMQARERRAVRVLTREDTYGRYVSVLVYLPRDRYNTTVRERFAAILREQLGAESVEFTVGINESTTARVHFVVRPPRQADVPEVDTADLEQRLARASRSWTDDFLAAVVSEYGEQEGTTLGRRYARAWPEAYKEDFPPRTGALDVGRLERIEGPSGLDLILAQPLDAEPGAARLKVFRIGDPISLSRVLPIISSMGVEVVDERPYELEGLDRRAFVYEFGLAGIGELADGARELFTDALRAAWDGASEVDGFNALVLGAGLTWRQVSVLRAYAKYLRQGGSPFSQTSIEQAMRANVDIARLLVALFEARFDPGLHGPEPDAESRVAAVEQLETRIGQALDDVSSLDHDRVLRSYLTLVRATLRTNYFRPEGDRPDGDPRPYLSLKLDPGRIPDLPEPRPRFEIFVYSPRVEGVHLRFGAVARGGLRWSDRRDDYRTEVLGLVKAQMVKNTVIVPVGAKGGFYAKRLPDPGDRDAWYAEGVACYRTFIRGLLDVTDNRVDGETVPPPSVVRHDDPDSYLVVAADKGTASFSDIANDLAADYGFWLGDAFASGGSVGYDHKAMGITARGAWVSVQRHFRERGIDCQSTDFTCVGIGDMSGDVFGNGMLCSEHIRLVAAFDHRDIFLDPDPDAAVSYAERRRLFEQPRSSWRDYDPSLISAGGGVYPRTAKKIPVTDQVRAALGLGEDVRSLTPPELIRAILRAPVDLLWNGGVGTYVKGSAESHADVGDKANDAVRVDGRDVRAKAIGEGGNLGLTQAGRIEYARSGAGGGGGRVNTDFIDNSAGVDTSDHEVNLKILLDGAVAAGDLTLKQRNELLARMTDDVAALVLTDNYDQNIALANAAAHAPGMLHVHEEWMRRLEKQGHLNREIEGLPSTAEVRRRAERGEGLTTPELAVLLAWTKIVLVEELLAAELPDDPYRELLLEDYFPEPVREAFPERVSRHPLSREIVVTQAVGYVVNGSGITFWPRLAAETGASALELTRACFVSREIFGARALRAEVDALDNVLPAAVQTRMRLEIRTLVERSTRWLVTTRHRMLQTTDEVEGFRARVQSIAERLPGLLTGRDLAAYQERRAALEADGVPEELASRIATLLPRHLLLGIIDLADREGLDPVDVARVHFALGERLGLAVLAQRIADLPRTDQWQTMARAALRDDLYSVHTQLTGQVLESTPAQESAPARIAIWEDQDPELVARAASTLAEICADGRGDLARMSVGLRVVRGLVG